CIRGLFPPDRAHLAAGQCLRLDRADHLLSPAVADKRVGDADHVFLLRLRRRRDGGGNGNGDESQECEHPAYAGESEFHAVPPADLRSPSNVLSFKPMRPSLLSHSCRSRSGLLSSIRKATHRVGRRLTSKASREQRWSATE